MNIFHHLFSNLSYFIYNVSKNLKFKEKNSLRVLMYHDIKKNEYKKFEDQINIIKDDGWKFLHPNELFNLSINKKKIKGKNIILTFDDGFHSNSIIEKKILAKYKIKAAFFIPYNFMKSKNKKEALKFIKKRLKIFDYKAEKDERINMNLNDILILSKKKHVIGFHTKNHIELSKSNSINEVQDEIIGYTSKSFEILINKSKFFSFPFGKLSDFDKRSYFIAKSKFKFIFLGIRGDNNSINLNKRLFFRDNFQLSYNKKMVLSILNGYFDIFYIKKRIKVFNEYL